MIFALIGLYAFRMEGRGLAWFPLTALRGMQEIFPLNLFGAYTLGEPKYRKQVKGVHRKTVKHY